MSGQLESFLTPARQRRIAEAVELTNQYMRQVLRDSGHIFQRKSALQRAQVIRSWLTARVAESLSADEMIINCIPNNIYGLQVDQRYFLDFKKLPSPDTCPAEPRTLREARLERSRRGDQLPLFELEIIPVVQERPLNELEHFTIGYSTDGYFVTQVFVQDVDRTNEQVIDYFQIEFTSVEDTQEESPPPLQASVDGKSRVKFVVKSKDSEEESKSA